MASVSAGPNGKAVLLVSDNPELTRFFKETVEARLAGASVAIDYRYSSINKNSAPMQSLGASAIDLKDASTVEAIINAYDVVISAHCKQIFPPALVGGVRCVNIHPGFNPYNRGWYPQVFGILNGKPLGATIHLMDAAIDHGPIIAQSRIALESGDTSLTAYRKIIAAEKLLIEQNLDSMLSADVAGAAPSQEGNYNGVADFKALCDLDLDGVGTLREHLDLLRALTHGDFRNAYFTDAGGRKYFVRVVIEAEDAAADRPD